MVSLFFAHTVANFCPKLKSCRFGSVNLDVLRNLLRLTTKILEHEKIVQFYLRTKTSGHFLRSRIFVRFSCKKIPEHKNWLFQIEKNA